jgi:hypothetical protein
LQRNENRYFPPKKGWHSSMKIIPDGKILKYMKVWRTKILENVRINLNKHGQYKN